MYSFTDKYNYDQPTIKGLSQHIVDNESKIHIIPNGFDTNFWIRQKKKRDISFITVASGLNPGNIIYYLKGINLMVKLAKMLPSHLFAIVGWEKNLKMANNSNIINYPHLDKLQLLELYSRSRFYLQLSKSEGFPNSLCEAMLCECTPIVSNITSMPEIIADTGYIIEKPNVNNLFNTVQTALENTDFYNKEARNVIVSNFSIDNRAHLLNELIQLKDPK